MAHAFTAGQGLLQHHYCGHAARPTSNQLDEEDGSSRYPPDQANELIVEQYEGRSIPTNYAPNVVGARYVLRAA